MDVGDPSNFVRILELFNKEFRSLKEVMSSYSFSDEKTKEILGQVFREKKYLLDPHGAVGYGALKKYLQQHPGQKGIFLETAHPVKFYDVVEPVVNEKVPMPQSVQDLLKLKKISIKMRSDYRELKEYLLSE
jgi:threonine synthase